MCYFVFVYYELFFAVKSVTEEDVLTATDFQCFSCLALFWWFWEWISCDEAKIESQHIKPNEIETKCIAKMCFKKLKKNI